MKSFGRSFVVFCLIASGVRKSAAQEDTYDNGLCSAIQSNEWQWDGTVVGEITEEDVGDKFISTEEACKICEDNPDCYYYSCIGSRFGSGCTLYGDDAVKIDLECDMCTNWNGELDISYYYTSPSPIPSNPSQATQDPSPPSDGEEQRAAPNEDQEPNGAISMTMTSLFYGIVAAVLVL